MDQPKQKGKLNIQLSEDQAEGTYSNLAIITHSPTEFVLDFVRVMPGVPQARVKSRVIFTPQHAKRLLNALQENIRKYEAQHGPIGEVMGFDQMMNMNFGGPTGEA